MKEKESRADHCSRMNQLNFKIFNEGTEAEYMEVIMDLNNKVAGVFLRNFKSAFEIEYLQGEITYHGNRTTFKTIMKGELARDFRQAIIPLFLGIGNSN